MDIPCSKWSSNKESTKLNLGHWYITASNIAYQYGMSPSRPDVFEPSLEMVGSVEFDPPPSPSETLMAVATATTKYENIRASRDAEQTYFQRKQEYSDVKIGVFFIGYVEWGSEGR